MAVIAMAIFALAIPPPAYGAPNNDAFGNATDLGSESTASITGSNEGATKEIGEPDHAGDPGGASVWYRWTAPSSGQVRIHSCASDFDTLVAVYTGTTIAGLTPIASNDQACGNQSRLVFTAVSGTTYRIAVDGWSEGGALSADQGSIELVLGPPDPPGNDDFADAFDLGSSFSNSITDTTMDATKELAEPDHAGDPGGASVWYRWTPLAPGRVRIDVCASRFDTLLAVYTGPSLALLDEVASSDQACGNQSDVAFDVLPGVTYWIAVDGWSDGGGKPPEQGRIDLNLRQANPPANDDFADAYNLGTDTNVAVGVTNVDATKQAGEPNHAGDPGGASVWYRWTAPSSGPVRATTCETFFAFDTLVAVYSGTSVNSLAPVAANDEYCGVGQSWLVFDATAGSTYWIAVDGYSFDGKQHADEGFVDLKLKVLNPPPNDDFADAQNLGSASDVTVTGTNVQATKEPGEPNHSGDLGGTSVWYRWTAPQTMEYRVETCGSDFDTMTSVYGGSSLGSLSRIDRGDFGCALDSFQSRENFPATAGTTYYIAVDGDTYDNTVPPPEGSISLRIYPSPDQPQDMRPPLAQAQQLPGPVPTVTGQREAALKKCKKKHRKRQKQQQSKKKGAARKKCMKRARRLPL